VPGRFAIDADYPTLWQHITRLRDESQRYGHTGRRHLRLALLHIAAGNYERAARESCLSLAAGHGLAEAHYALCISLLGQALVAASALEPGPAARVRPLGDIRWLAQAATVALRHYVQARPHDEEARTLEHTLCQALTGTPDALGRRLSAALLRPDGP
jgi:hypothetical protein